MKFTFSDQRFERMTTRDIERDYGKRVDKALERRINTIENVQGWGNLFEAAGRFHPLRGDRKGDFAFDLDGKWRLILRQSEDEQSVVIVGIADYHEG